LGGGDVITPGGLAVPEIRTSAQFQNSSGYDVPQTVNVGLHQEHPDGYDGTGERAA